VALSKIKGGPIVPDLAAATFGSLVTELAALGPIAAVSLTSTNCGGAHRRPVAGYPSPIVGIVGTRVDAKGSSVLCFCFCGKHDIRS